MQHTHALGAIAVRLLMAGIGLCPFGADDDFRVRVRLRVRLRVRVRATARIDAETLKAGAREGRFGREWLGRLVRREAGAGNP